MNNTIFRPLGLALLSGVILGTVLPAQTQDELMERRDNKLAASFLQNASWVTDYTKALAEAKKSKKLIFGYFTRSFAP